jgi:hypothetical protein
MKITGTAMLKAPPQQVWDAFHDPAVLARCLPGCNSLTELGPDEYAMNITAGVAAIKGTYDGKVQLLDTRHPEQFTMKAAGAGAPGTVDAEVVVRLSPSPDGGTSLTYDADAAVGGAIGGVGQRMLAGVTKKMAGQFFAAVDDDIAGVRPAEMPSAAERAAAARPLEAVGTAVPGTVGAAEGQPRVYAGRAAAGTGEPSRVKDFALGVAAGGLLALAGVIVGWAIGGRS